MGRSSSHAHTKSGFCPMTPRASLNTLGNTQGCECRAAQRAPDRAARRDQAGCQGPNCGLTSYLEARGPGRELSQWGLRMATWERAVGRPVPRVSQPSLPSQDAQLRILSISQLPGCPGILAMRLPGPADHRATGAVTESPGSPEEGDAEQRKRIPSSGGSKTKTRPNAGSHALLSN